MNDGGPAFPGRAMVNDREGIKVDLREWGGAEDGMSLLDHFAGLAMLGELTANGGLSSEQKERVFTARLSYDMAKAMIAERERRLKEPQRP